MVKRIILAVSLILAGLVSAQAQYIAPYAGAASRTNNSKMADIVSVFDFIPVSLQAAIKAGTSTTDVSSYLAVMHAAVPAGVKFVFPAGQYNIGAGATAMTGRAVDITGVTFTGGGSITGTYSFESGNLRIKGSSTGYTAITSPNAGATNYSLALPAANDTVAVLGTPQTFTAQQNYNAIIQSVSTNGSTVVPIFQHDPTITGTIGTAVGNVADINFGTLFQPVRWTNNGNYIDNTWHLGMNVGTSAGGVGRDNTSEPNLVVSFESKFWNGAVFGQEWHVQGVDSTGVTTFRPLSIYVSHDGATKISGGWKVDNWTVTSAANVLKLQYTTSSNRLGFLDSANIGIGTNNIAAIQQLNAAGSAYVDLLKLDAGNVTNMSAPLYVAAARAGAAAPFPGSFIVFQPTTANSNDVIVELAAPTITGNIYGWRAGGAVTGSLIGTLRNDATGASSHARLEVVVADASAGDPYIYFTDQVSKNLSIGLDNSASAFKVSFASTLGNSDALSINTTSRTALFTPAANSVAIQATGYSLTGSDATSLVDLAGTWNTTGTPSAIKLNITNTASNADAFLLDLRTDATAVLTLRSDGRLYTAGAIATQASGSIGFRSADNITASQDVSLYRDGAADMLALRRTTNAQTLRGYYTFTNSTNYQRWALQTGADYIELAAETAGTGADNLDLRLTPAGTGNISFPGGVLLKTRAALTDGAGVGAGTITNAPAAGNPTKWIPINDNGTTRYMPAW